MKALATSVMSDQEPSLAATGLPVCLLINFGKKVEVKRSGHSSR